MVVKEFKITQMPTAKISSSNRKWKRLSSKSHCPQQNSRAEIASGNIGHSIFNFQIIGAESDLDLATTRANKRRKKLKLRRRNRFRNRIRNKNRFRYEDRPNNFDEYDYENGEANQVTKSFSKRSKFSASNHLVSNLIGPELQCSDWTECTNIE